MISVCMKRSGGPNRSDSGAVDDATGASFSSNCEAVNEGGIGPAPEDPVSVTCGALYRARRGSKRSLISRINLPASPPTSAMMKMPLACNYLCTIDMIGITPPLFDICTPARRKSLSSLLSGCEC